MLKNFHLRDPILINTIGHTAGVLLFGLIVVLLVRDWRAHGVRQTRLPLIAAALAFCWNLGSLIALASPDPGSSLIGAVMTCSFSVLSLLPAVLLQVVLGGKHRRMVLAGYTISAIVVSLHFVELFSPEVVWHQASVLLIVGGFGVLSVVSFFLRRGFPLDDATERSEWISLACLLLFSSSFLHFGYHHVTSPWAAEIAWHHIGIPVALIVLLQDYRFLLLDTFMRFLVNFGLAAVYISALLVLNDKFRLWNLPNRSAFMTGLVLVLFCLSLISFASLRNALQVWISRVVFRRRSADRCIKAIQKVAASARSEDELLARASGEIALHLRTDRCAISEKPAATKTWSRDRFSIEAAIPLRLSSGDTRYLTAGARRGGRRYFSEDLEEMRRFGSVIVEQVERFRAEELKRLVSQAELRALQAQINPHFLFNALNTLYGTIDRRSQDARRMVMNLADIFRYFLQGDRAVICLSEELRIVEAYLEIEGLRLGNRLQKELIVSEAARSSVIPILSIQPLVENAVKHGIAAKQGGGRVSVRADKTADGLRVVVEDTGVGFESSRGNGQNGAGVGLENVRRRLTLSYGAAAELEIESSMEGSSVRFFIPDAGTGASQLASPSLGTEPAYRHS